ncbi:MAG: PBP1A family penicillin-binding protein [bacterium]
MHVIRNVLNGLKAIKKIFHVFSGVIGWLSWIMLFVICIGLAFVVGFFSQVVQDMPLLDKLSVPEPVQASRIYTADNQLLGKVYAEKGNRIILSYEQIPTNLKQALIAIEDRDFYNHRGIDFKGITRAFKANIEAGGIQQGGSTITQQLVRKLFLEKESDALDKYLRKIKEMIIALRLETKYSKDEIITFYLNEMFFGANSYGVEAASMNYFGKVANELTLSEAALLAGIPQAPSLLNPYQFFDKAVARRNLVLKAMLDEKHITREEYNSAKAEEVVLAGQKSRGYKDLKHPYYGTYVLEEAKKLVGQRKLFFGGLRIYTTLDTEAQTVAEKKLVEYIQSDEFQKAKISQGAFVLIDVETGAVKSMVGGVDFEDNEFNRAWQARRQPGSAFKPFVYLAALDAGYSPGSLVIDEPLKMHDAVGRNYSPQNYDHKYLGIMTMKKALELSRNVIAVKTCDLVTPEKVVEWAKHLGIHNGDLVPVISIALGTGVVSVLEMTTAFATIANDGVYNQPYAIRLITDSNGQIIYQHKKNEKRAAPKNLMRILTYMLRGVVLQGTGTRANIKRECAGKTGTTSDYKDAWFVGYTPEYAASVWVGNDDESIHMKRVTGGVFPARIWHDIMEAITINLPEKKFPPPLRFPPALLSLEKEFSQQQLEKMLQNQIDEKGDQKEILEPGDEVVPDPDKEKPGTVPIPKPGEGGGGKKPKEPIAPF